MDNYTRSSLNLFAANPLERMTEKRQDTEWLVEQLTKTTTRIVPIWRTQNLVSQNEPYSPIFLTPDQMEEPPGVESTILLGMLNGTAYFSLDVGILAKDEPPAHLLELGKFEDLRTIASQVHLQEASILAYARAITFWHQRQQFCGDCGDPTQSADAGFAHVCTGENCGKQHFPRTDPAIIVLIENGEKCLLARQPTWPKHRYSVIAGFVEPGESLEDAVKREVYEEAGIQVGAVHYHSSQPWPFPNSLMLGFMAHATSTDIQLVDQELEEARWLSRKEIVSGIQNGTLKLPPNISISHRLIESWFDAGDCGQLRDLVHEDW